MIEPDVPSLAAPEKGSDRRRALGFAATIALVLVGIAAFKALRGSPRSVVPLASAATALVLLSLAVPRLVLLLRKGWLWLGGVLGRINSAIILSVLYLLVVTPLGLLMRLAGKRSFRPDPGADYFSARSPRDRKHFERPY